MPAPTVTLRGAALYRGWLMPEAQARLAYHGVDRLRPGSSRLLRRPGRINLTMRVVT